MTDASPPARITGAWFLLALGALGISALCAVFLIVARTPFLGQGAATFRTALVLHVDFAVVIWFLAVAGGIWSLAGRRTSAMGWIALALAAMAPMALLGAAIARDAVPILSNYIPILEHPLSLGALAAFIGAVALAGIAALPALWRSELPWRHAAVLSIVALLIALAVLAIDAARPSDIAAVGIDDLLWGFGHTLQFVHILLLMAVWQSLGRPAAARIPGLEQAGAPILALAFVPVMAAPVIAFLQPVGSVEYRAWFSILMRWGTWPGAALLGVGLLAGLTRIARDRPLQDAERGLGLSLLLFAVGCVLGAFIRNDSLSVPAHYHGTVGAITLAYLVWLHQQAGQLGISPRLVDPVRRLPLFYGFGILMLVAGLAAAGYLGVPRKAPHADLSVDSASYLSAMGIAGIGGFIALTAVLAFVAIGFRAAYRSCQPVDAERRRDWRGWAITVTLLLVVCGGWLLNVLPGGGPAGDFSPRRHASEKIRAEIDTRFQQGVVMLHARQYDHAVTAFHRVLQLAPEAPEAYVNMGFALIGLKRYREAHDFFESATMLRRSQINAYYGLAVALEGMGDLPGALGAMQTYTHLAKTDDPFRTKAEAAIWEWRAQLEASRSSAKGATK